MATPITGQIPTLKWRELSHGDGWSVSEVDCVAGPNVRPQEEQHSAVCIAIVKSGSFLYHANARRELMTPGSIMLGNAGQHYRCTHEHSTGDKCIAFTYEPQFIEDVVAGAGVGVQRATFSRLRIPAIRQLSGVVSRAGFGLSQSHFVTHGEWQTRFWEELSIELVGRCIGPMRETTIHDSCSAAEARITRIIRLIEENPDDTHSLGNLARQGRVSKYHLVRMFQRLTGLTPHQYVLRNRLRLAAIRLLEDPGLILDVAYASGFGDVSNFNHAFRNEFGINPRAYRDRWRKGDEKVQYGGKALFGMTALSRRRYLG